MKGYYSIIQYCPDLGRMECANIGVVVAVPEACYLEVRDDEEVRRVKKLFPDCDAAEVGFACRGIVDRIMHDGECSVQWLESFISTRANNIIMTPLRPMRVDDLREDVDKLYEELVS